MSRAVQLTAAILALQGCYLDRSPESAFRSDRRGRADGGWLAASGGTDAMIPRITPFELVIPDPAPDSGDSAPISPGADASRTPVDAGAPPALDAGTLDAMPPEGGSDASVDAGTDVGTPCTEYDWYPDADSDGFGDHSVEPVIACKSPGPGYSATSTPDCYDANGLAKPGQAAWFSTDRGDGSFDYNCDGLEAPERVQFGACPALDPDCPPPTQWPGGFTCDYEGLTVPGEEGWYVECAQIGSLHGITQCEVYATPVLPPCGTTGLWKWSAASCPGSSTLNSLVMACR